MSKFAPIEVAPSVRRFLADRRSRVDHPLVLLDSLAALDRSGDFFSRVTIAVASGLGTHLVQLAVHEVREDNVVLTTSARTVFGRAVARGVAVAGLFDGVPSLGVSVTFSGVASLVRDSGTILGFWRARNPASRAVFAAKASADVRDEALTQQELREKAASVDPSVLPPDFTVVRVHVDEFKFCFLGGADRCHGYLRYRRNRSGWLKEDLRA